MCKNIRILVNEHSKTFICYCARIYYFLFQVKLGYEKNIKYCQRKSKKIFRAQSIIQGNEYFAKYHMKALKDCIKLADGIRQKGWNFSWGPETWPLLLNTWCPLTGVWVTLCCLGWHQLTGDESQGPLHFPVMLSENWWRNYTVQLDTVHPYWQEKSHISLDAGETHFRALAGNIFQQPSENHSCKKLIEVSWEYPVPFK